MCVLGRRLGQGLIQIRDQIVRALCPDADTYDVCACACGLLLLRRQLAVRGRGGVDDQRACIAEVGDVAKDLQRVDQLDAGIIAAFDREGEQAAGAVGADSFAALVIGRGFETSVGHILNAVICIMCRLWVHGHAQIAQADGDAKECERQIAERLMELKAVVGRLGLAQGWELVRCGPIEVTAVYNAATRDGAVASQVFGGGVYNERCAMLDRAAQVGRGGGVVDDQRDLRRVRDVGNGAHIHDIATGVGDGFAKYRAGVVVNCGFHGIEKPKRLIVWLNCVTVPP